MLRGITDVEFVSAEGLAINDESKYASLARAHSEIDHISEQVVFAL